MDSLCFAAILVRCWKYVSVGGSLIGPILQLGPIRCEGLAKNASLVGPFYFNL